MKKCIIKFMDGTTTEITEEDHKNLIGKSGLVFVSSICQSVNISIIARIVPENMADELEDKKKQTHGTLHDGLLVVRHFGSWFVDGEFDEKGNPYKRVDQSYYKEVQKDCVPTRKEYETKYKMLPREERLKLILNKAVRNDDMKEIGFIKSLK